MKRLAVLVLAVVMSGSLGACAVGAGAGAAGAAYEYQNKEALEKLERQLEEGEISQEEYLRRKQEIEEGSVVY